MMIPVLLALILWSPTAVPLAEPLQSPAPEASSASEPAPEPTMDQKYAGNDCIACHRDLPGRSSEIVQIEWRHSVHYDAGVACNDCHGGDAALKRESFDTEEAWKAAAHGRRDPEFLVMDKPGEGFVSAVRGRAVSYFCGKCHADIKEKHLGSPHGDFGDPTCLYCHGQGSHKITPPTLDIIDTRPRSENGRCSPCHQASSMETVKRIKTLLEKTEQSIGTSGQQYEELEDWGYRNLQLEQLHAHAQEVRSQLRQVFHSFNLLEISNFTGEIQDVVDTTNATHGLIARLRAAKRRQAIIGSSVTLMLLTLAGVLWYYKHTFLEPHAVGGSPR